MTMMSDNQAYREKFKSLPIFAALTEQEFNQIFTISQIKQLNANEVLIEEGQVSHEMYILLEGEMDIYKKGEESYFKGVLKHKTHLISHPKEGSIIGEIGLFDQSSRSATVKALTPCVVASIGYQEIKQLADTNPKFNKVLLGFCQNVCKNLRHTNDVVVKALEKNISEYNMRYSMSMFVMQIIVAFSLLSFLLSGLNYLGHGTSITTFITIPMTLLFLVLIFLLIRSSNLPWSMFGLTMRNWDKSLIDVALTLPFLLILVVFVKMWLIFNVPQFYGRNVFEPFKDVAALAGGKYTLMEVWWMVMLSYWFFTAPIQELIVRGGLQGCLDYFLVARNKTFQSILISNMIFSTMHLFISFEVTCMVFVGGLYFGWLYSRNKTLIGVTLAHAISGTWLLGIVGV